MALLTGVFDDLIAVERQRIVEQKAADQARVAEKRSSLENPQTPLSYPSEWLLDMFNGGRTDSGIRVSEMTALQCATVLTCVDLIAGKIASLPIHVYERSMNTNGRAVHRVAYEHDYYEIVHTEPNPEMTRQVFLKAYIAHALLWGNAYAEIQRNAGYEAVAIWPRNPGKTKPRRFMVDVHLAAVPWRPYPVTIPAGALCYETTDGLEKLDTSEAGATAATTRRIMPAEDVLFLPGLSLDGRIGQELVWMARNIIGLALASEKFGAKYFANFAKPGGILVVPAGSKEQRDQARNSWNEAQGGENTHRVAVMPPGTGWTPMSNNPEEAQVIQARQYSRTEIAALFHVPGRMVGDNTRQSKASTEQENIEFLDYTISPWLSAYKLECKRKLFPHPGVGRRPKSPFYIDFDTSEMVRAAAADREKFYASGKQWGYLCTNDILAQEKMNPVDAPWAEEYWIPVNMTLVTTPINPNQQDGAGNGDAEPRALWEEFKDFVTRQRALPPSPEAPATDPTTTGGGGTIPKET